MTIAQAVSLIKKHRPSTVADFNRIGVKLERKEVGSGVFRIVRKIKDLPLVVKFPVEEKMNGLRDGKMHTTVEVRKIRKLEQKRSLRPHLPKIYYHDKKTGILVMRWYRAFEDDVDALRALGKLVTKLLRKQTGITVSDIHEDNVRMGRDIKTAVVIDFGY